MGKYGKLKKTKTTFADIIRKSVYKTAFLLILATILVLILLFIIAEHRLVSEDNFLLLLFALIIVTPFFCVGVIKLVTTRTSVYLKNKTNSIVDATKKIKNHELDFAIEYSGIKDIDEILEAIDDMRESLRKALVEQWLTEKNKKDQMLSLAHDVKTPLTIIKGNLDLMQAVSHDEMILDCSEDAMVSIKDMEMYIAKLIESLKQQDALSFHKTELSFDQIVTSCTKKYQQPAEAKKIQLILDIENNNTYSLLADEQQMKRMLDNLLDNALFYAPESGRIKVQLKKSNSHICLTIENTGDGFSQDVLLHGTEQFYMKDKSRNNENHYGLGLYIVANIVREHQGTMTLKNQEDGAAVEIIFYDKINKKEGK